METLLINKLFNISLSGEPMQLTLKLNNSQLGITITKYL